MPTLKKPKESNVVKGCLQALSLAGFMAWRNNTGSYAVPAQPGQKRRYIRYGAKGSSDILAIQPPNGRAWAIECKRPGQTLTDDQQTFHEEVLAVGGVSCVVHDVEELLACLGETR